MACNLLCIYELKGSKIYRIINDPDEESIRHGKGEVKDVPQESLKAVMKKGFKVNGIGIDATTGEIKVNDCAESRYYQKAKGIKLVSSDDYSIGTMLRNEALEQYADKQAEKDALMSVVVLCEHIRSNGEVYYRIADIVGNIFMTKEDNLAKNTSGYEAEVETPLGKAKTTIPANIKLVNAKVVERDGSKFVSAIYGEFRCYKEQAEEKEKLTIQEKKEILLGTSNKKRPWEISGMGVRKKCDKTAEYAFGIEKDENGKEVVVKREMTINQVFARCTSVIARSFPFLGAIIRTSELVETVELPTMATDGFKIYYNADFVLSHTLSELAFVLLHETLHIAMGHQMRKGKRNSYLFNVVCDYIINKSINEELARIATTGRDGKKFASEIIIPGDCLYMNSVDVKKDTPEGLYKKLKFDELERQMNQMMSTMSGEGQGQGQGQNGQGQSGQGQSQGQNGQGQSGQGQSGQGHTPFRGEIGHNKKNNEQGSGNGQDQNGQGQGQNGQGQGSGAGQGQNAQDGKKSIKVTTADGKIIDITEVKPDLVETPETKQMSDEQKKQATRAKIDKAKVYQKIHREGGTTYGSGYDGTEFGLDDFYKDLFDVRLNWTSVLKNIERRAYETINSYAAPDRRYRAMGKIVPGETPFDDGQIGAQVFIDTSGSISNEELLAALSSVYTITKKFKAKGTVQYWGSDISDPIEFENVRDIVSKRAVAQGGTDWTLVFRWLEQGNKKHFQLDSEAAIIIITDGYINFDMSQEEYKKWKKYSRRTIWLVTSCKEAVKQIENTIKIGRAYDISEEVRR